MGYGDVLWVYEDGIRNQDRSKLAPIVGEGVLDLCLDESFYSVSPPEPSTGQPRPEDLRRVRSKPVLGHVNCINWVGKYHSTDEVILVWARNCLRPLSALDDEELRAAKELFDEETRLRDSHQRHGS